MFAIAKCCIAVIWRVPDVSYMQLCLEALYLISQPSFILGTQTLPSPAAALVCTMIQICVCCLSTSLFYFIRLVRLWLAYGSYGSCRCCWLLLLLFWLGLTYAKKQLKLTTTLADESQKSALWVTKICHRRSCDFTRSYGFTVLSRIPQITDSRCLSSCSL